MGDRAFKPVSLKIKEGENTMNYLQNEKEDKIEKLKNNKLGENDTFEFGCTQCGECCRNRHDILLLPYDLYRIAKFLNLTISEVIVKYCECYIGNDSHIPIVRARPKIHNDVCPFLRKGKCSIHEAKPAICALFPLGRAADGLGNIRYFYGGGCDVANKTKITLKEWLEMFNLKESEEPARLWGETVLKICTAKMHVKKSKENDDKLNSAIYMVLYTDYKTDRDFLPQFKKNIEFIYTAFEMIYGKSVDKILKGVKLNALCDLS